MDIFDVESGIGGAEWNIASKRVNQTVFTARPKLKRGGCARSVIHDLGALDDLWKACCP